MQEIDEIGKGTRCLKPVYHAIISAAHGEKLTQDQVFYSVDLLLKNVGLDEHQAAIVEHIKEGETHYHIVVNRIDIETMKAVRMSHNYRAHELTARELEKELGLQHVKGVHVLENDEIRAKYGPNHGDIKQAEKSNYNPYKWRNELRELVAGKSGQDLLDTLAAHGHIVAHGDNVDFIVLDPAGNAKRLAGQIGVKVSDLRKMLGNIDKEQFPNEVEAREIQQAYKARLALGHQVELVAQQAGVTPAHEAEKQENEQEHPGEDRAAHLGATLYDRAGMVSQQRDANRHAQDRNELKEKAAREGEQKEKAARAAPILAHEKMQKEVAQQEQERKKREEPGQGLPQEQGQSPRKDQAQQRSEERQARTEQTEAQQRKNAMNELFSRKYGHSYNPKDREEWERDRGGRER